MFDTADEVKPNIIRLLFKMGNKKEINAEILISHCISLFLYFFPFTDVKFGLKTGFNVSIL